MAKAVTTQTCRNRARRSHRTGLVGLLLATLSLSASADMVTAAVAANFTGTMQKLMPLFEQRTGHQVRASYGSTGKLYAQIRQGAPFDVFLAADRERPELLEQQELGVPGSRFTYARGRLALWSRSQEAFNDPEAYLSANAGARLAIGNPRTAPYGVAAMEALDTLGLQDTIGRRLVRGDSIAQTFQFVATGNAEAGFVALAQLRAWNGESGASWVVPASLHRPIEQQAILLTRSENPEAARAWLDFLASEEARAIIEKDGYDTGDAPEP
ncbi:molybdate ABC transporter substrate-binding protein [Marinobacter pelagius]|uniref:molybdate ABC transporter substrate-binding protein n=1 Tax=Marinobacter sp. C7 TaxID=2951363 RepID=UPI001EF0C88B|nr:molybdate ABC transporter substrate-binding protein [Marinobacter sp. C7]MCG7198242.1 molybdate ABC transporter substrate-binding protein [Marinobacter sp. C7]